MPFLRITDTLGVNLDIQLAPLSTFVQYARDLPAMLLQNARVADIQALSLSNPAVKSVAPTLTFQQPVSLGDSAPALTIKVEGGINFVIGSAPPADFGDDLAAPSGTCYVRVGLHAGVGAGIQTATGPVTFGFEAGTEIGISSYRLFPTGAGAPNLASALGTSISEFTIPASAKDLQSLPEDTAVVVFGRGRLQFSVGADLLAVTNPLATAALPSPLPSFSVTATATVSIAASLELFAEYEVMVRKRNGRVRLGWFRKQGTEFTVRASARAGITAGSPDLASSVLGAISPSAKADLNELTAAGLTADRAQSLALAVSSAINRKLELAAAAELGASTAKSTAFLYDVDLSALDDAGITAIRDALAGNLSGLTRPGPLPAGISVVHSIFGTERIARTSLKVNLLGIFNYASVSRLVLTSTVTFTPSTGELVIVDEATAARTGTLVTNAGPDEEKLRQLLAESFLITAAYRGSGTLVSGPALSSSHLFFRLDAHTTAREILRYNAIARALGIEPAALPAGVSDFGRTSFLVDASYDDALSRALFFRPDGTPRTHDEYEAAGRRAIAQLVLPDGDDAFRLGPATDDSLWRRMEALGPSNFQQLMSPEHAAGVRPDYLAIQWWANSMCDTSKILARFPQKAAPDDPAFVKLRKELADCLRDVADKAREQFGTPWGLVAMFLAGGSRAATEVHIIGPHYVFTSR